MKQAFTVLSVILLASLLQSATTSNIESKKRVTSAALNWTWDPSVYPSYFKIYVNSVLTVDQTTGSSGALSLSSGDIVRIEVGVPPNGALTFLVEDHNYGELYYSDDEKTITFSFTAIDGHSYQVYADA